MEALDLAGIAGTGDWERLIDELGCLAGVQRGGDHAGVCLSGKPGRIDIGLTEDQAIDADRKSSLYHVRLIAAEDDGILRREQEVLVILRKCDADLAGDGIRCGVAFVDDPAFQNA